MTLINCDYIGIEFLAEIFFQVIVDTRQEVHGIAALQAAWRSALQGKRAGMQHADQLLTLADKREAVAGARIVDPAFIIVIQHVGFDGAVLIQLEVVDKRLQAVDAVVFMLLQEVDGRHFHNAALADAALFGKAFDGSPHPVAIGGNGQFDIAKQGAGRHAVDGQLAAFAEAGFAVFVRRDVEINTHGVPAFTDGGAAHGRIVDQARNGRTVGLLADGSGFIYSLAANRFGRFGGRFLSVGRRLCLPGIFLIIVFAAAFRIAGYQQNSE